MRTWLRGPRHGHATTPLGTACRLTGVEIALIFGALGVMTAACGRSPGFVGTPSRLTGEVRYGIGQTAEVDGWQVTVHRFTLLAATPVAAPSVRDGVPTGWSTYEDRQPSPGYVFCAVEVTLENRSDTIRFFMPERQMTLRVENGTQYELDYNASVMAARSQQWIVPDGEISIGETARGAASYKVPADARGLSWVFRSSLLPGAQMVIFDLGNAPQ